MAKVAAIFKSETRLLWNNYRPISLLSSIGKIIEKWMHERLDFFLEQYNCYYPFQFGFRLNYSTNSALMSIVENIQIELDNAGSFRRFSMHVWQNACANTVRRVMLWDVYFPFF